MQDGDLVAILRTGAGVGALQQFTSDKRMLYAAIERVRWNPMSGKLSAFAPLSTGPASGDADDGMDSDGPRGAETDQVRALEDFRSSTFSVGTLGALRYIIQGMRDLPGRKSVVFFSEGFPMFEMNLDRPGGATPMFDFMKVLADEANRSSVVIYAIDPRGLTVTGLTAADNTSGMTASQVQQAIEGRGRMLSETQGSLTYLARQTGGYAVINNNDTAGALKRVVEDTSYYLVAYEPEDDTFDPARLRFNNIMVKVLRPGAQARFRSGFFNVAEKPKPTVRQADTKPGGNSLLQALLSPFGETGINLRFNALFGNDTASGSYVRSMMHIPADELLFSDNEDGKRKTQFDLIAIAFGDNGAIVDQLSRSYTVSVDEPTFERIRREGFVYHFTFPVKRPGAFQYRVALRDPKSGNIGSVSQFVEVPDVKKKRLQMSGIVLQSFSNDQWRNQEPGANPFMTTALRRIPANTVLTYGCEVYNPRLNNRRLPELTAKIRIFHEGRLLLDGENRPVDLSDQRDMSRIKFSGSLAIGDKMQPGEYILQIIITDKLASSKTRPSTQFITFDVVN
jgi:VWFA-related protein